MTLKMLGVAATAAAALAAGTQAAADERDSPVQPTSSTRTTDASGQGSTVNGSADPGQPVTKAPAAPPTTIDNNASHSNLPGSSPSDPTTAGASLTGTAGGAHVQFTPVPLRQR
jgi:hypothetical protein